MNTHGDNTILSLDVASPGRSHRQKKGKIGFFFCPEIINLLSYGFNLSIVLFVLHLLASFRESVKRQMLKAGERCLTQ